MTVVARGFWLLRGRLGRVSALSRSAVSPFAAPGPAGQAFRGFRSGGVRYERSRTLDLLGSGRSRVRSHCLWEGRPDACSWRGRGLARVTRGSWAAARRGEGEAYLRSELGLAGQAGWSRPPQIRQLGCSLCSLERSIFAAGICSEIILKPKDVSQEELLDITDQLNVDPRVSGILVQLPLPDHMDERTVCNGISPEKDVDGFHIINIGRLCLDQHSLIPATASAVWEIIRRTGIETFGKNVVVAGRSKNVGMPIAMLLHTDGEHERPGGDATVTIAHRYTPKEQLKIHTLLADVIIVAAGVPKLITSDMVKEGAAVIDVGINYVRDPITGKTKLVGDVDFEGNCFKIIKSFPSKSHSLNTFTNMIMPTGNRKPVFQKKNLITLPDNTADYTEVPIALKFSHPCLEDHHSYCINGVCAFHHELEKAICRCFTGYTGERCEHLTLTSYAVDSYEKYIAIGIGVGLLLSGFLVIFYCYIRKRCSEREDDIRTVLRPLLPRADYETAGTLYLTPLAIQTEDNPRVAQVSITKCSADMNGYCLHGQCIYLVDMSENYCRCEVGYTGVRCEHFFLTVQKPLSKEYVALTVILVILFLVIVAGSIYYFCRWYRNRKSKEPKKEYERVTSGDPALPQV
ncbi:hypothetical protein JEQ12_017510 [Ovis aries]|uniref:Epigen n=1 Tax=Ovis aries TaxID=9940 RepID=A0A836A759_SHEEP|nr:hypothetical protein JEQ12_017510 [Ovis aries]